MNGNSLFRWTITFFAGALLSYLRSRLLFRCNLVTMDRIGPIRGSGFMARVTLLLGIYLQCPGLELGSTTINLSRFSLRSCPANP